MPGNTQATLFIRNLDERVDERLLFEIMVQAGPLVDVYIPRDKTTKKHKGYGFAEYTSEESASYALNLFPGLVCVYRRPLYFSISGADKTSVAGDKSVQVVDSPNINTTKNLNDSPHRRHAKIHDVLRQPNFALNYMQGPVYGTQSGGLAMETSSLNAMAVAQSYNYQLSVLGQHALQSQAYPRHPHTHVLHEV